MQLLIIIGVSALILFYFVGIYNNLVRTKTLVSEGWSGIDVQLKKRHDLIPNLLESVKGYMSYEQDTLQKVISARNAAVSAKGVMSQSQAENQLQSAIGGVFALAEQYPDLKASANFIQLQDALKDVENTIEQSRRYYNGAVRDFNRMIVVFPTNLIAQILGFKIEPFFEVAENEKKNVEIKF